MISVNQSWTKRQESFDQSIWLVVIINGNTQHRALVDATVFGPWEEPGVPGKPTQPQREHANFTTPFCINAILAVTQVMLFDVMPSLLVVVTISLNITAAVLKKSKLGGFPVVKWGLSHAAGEGRGEHMKRTRIFLNMTHQPWCVSLAWVKPCCGISSHTRQIPDVQPSVMKARRRYNNAFMPNSPFMKHDQPNGTKGNYKWQKHLAKHAISDKRLTKNSLAAYMCHNIHGHLIKVIPAFNPLPSF